MRIPRPAHVALTSGMLWAVCWCANAQDFLQPLPPASTPTTTQAESLFHYPQTAPAAPSVDYGSVVPTNGWPVAMPFEHYPQGAVRADGSGIYPCLLPGDPPDACFCTSPPCYFGTFYVAGVILDRRTDLRPAGLIYDATLTTELANTSEFNLDTRGGFRFGFWLTHPCGLDWNFEYFNVSNFEDGIVGNDPAGLNAFFFGGSFAAAPTTITAEYDSDFDSFELQVRARQWRRVAPLVGIRFLQLEEEFNLLNDTANRTGLFSTTDNELFGFQFGVQALVWEWYRARLEATLKAGVYYNDIDIEATNPADTSTTVASSSDWSAFAGDAKVSYVCQIGPRVNFRVSYQAIWIEGVALAVNQNTTRNFQNVIGPVDLTDVLYQGGEIGFEISW